MNASISQGGILTHDPQAGALWEKLRGLSFDHGAGPNTFAARLANEQGWTAGFTSRVIEEYRRFLLLFALEQRREKANASASGTPPAVRIVPSAMVDKVWHLHLLYTQSYWETLCRDILGEPLHHLPASGSPDESATLDQVYRANMEAYRTTFGELAPNDIWPAAKGTPPPGTPLAEILEPAILAAGLAKRASYFVTAGVLAPLVIFVLLAGGKPSNFDEPMGALAIVGGMVVAVCACISLFVGLVLTAGGPSRRRSTGADGESFFFSSGGEGVGSSSGHDGHSHGSHGGHSDSGGGHSCGGGHGCGGHGCGGH